MIKKYYSQDLLSMLLLLIQKALKLQLMRLDTMKSTLYLMVKMRETLTHLLWQTNII